MNDQTARAWPADKVERRAVSALVPYARNARTHSAEQVAKLAASIKRWGFTIPVLVDEAGGLIAGHGRVLAAKSLGLAEIPVMVAAGWSDEEKRAYVLADNQLALGAGWNNAFLKIELQELKVGGFDLGDIGFSTSALSALLANGGGESDPDADAPPPPATPVTLAGDVWLLGNHRIACGDSTKPETVGLALAGAKPTLMVTDPPYGVEYDASWRVTAKSTTKRGGKLSTGVHAVGAVKNDGRADWREAWALFPGDVAYVWHAGVHAGAVSESLTAADFAIRSQIIWAKNNMVIGRGDYHWHHEPCWYAVRNGKPGRWSGDRKQTTLWAIDKPQKSETGHSTQKPVECMRRPIENNSKEGEWVYEPFSGSGTTIIAGEMTGRRVIAIELNPAYVDVAVERWQAFSGGFARLEATGEPWAVVKADRLGQGRPKAAKPAVSERRKGKRA